MKKKSKKIIVLLSAILIILALCSGGYTYAKYKSTVKGDGVLDVAKWSFKVGGKTDRIETITLKDTVDVKKLVNGKVAPGTSGTINIEVDATGAEVGVDYVVKFLNEQNKPTNLIFMYNNQKYKTLQELNEVIKGTINADENIKKKTVTVTWEWPYESTSDIAKSDEVDTKCGIANLNYTFDIQVTGIQKAI